MDEETLKKRMEELTEYIEHDVMNNRFSQKNRERLERLEQLYDDLYGV